MSLPRGLWISISLCWLLVGSTAFAEGHGHGQGLNRALSAAARGSGSSGLARAAQSTNRSGSGLSKDGTKLGRSANGLNRASNGMSHSQALTAQTSNAARIRDNRLEQADHLREVSAQNGNARLLDTADRMQNSAQTNFDRRTGGTAATGGQAPGTDDGAAEA
ncbi:MAG: hypothetical protein K8R36_18240, partial [Planctomycetales bacterium]|nr:hypothetical protein [Planctomycetales bacterium]